jgi:hypothetical protein
VYTGSQRVKLHGFPEKYIVVFVNVLVGQSGARFTNLQELFLTRFLTG